MDLTNSWVVMVQGYTDNQGPAEYNAAWLSVGLRW
jgi:outer membrane protein OmpA-like peptidoglycan-associated protein